MSTTAQLDSVKSLEEKFLTDLDARREELAPAVQEYEQLTDLRERLTSRGSTRPRGGRRPGSGSNSTGAAPAAGLKPGGRLAKLVEIVKLNPGISVSDAAAKMGIAPNYVYRLRKQGEEGHLIKSEDGGMLAMDGAPPETSGPGEGGSE